MEKVNLNDFSRKELEARVQKLESSIKNYKLKIKNLVETENHLVYQLSHDLRTPLTPIISFLQIATLEEQSNSKKEHLVIALKNAKYLNLLLSDILNISKLNSKVKFNYQESDINDIIKKSIDCQKYLFVKKGIQILCHFDNIQPIKLDRIKFEEVMDNILKNALEYSEKNKKINIFTSVVKKRVQIVIQDEGIGIERENLKKVFKIFYRADKSRHEHNSGLGLSISKKIIEHHKGKIWAESEGLKKGSKFIMELPIK